MALLMSLKGNGNDLVTAFSPSTGVDPFEKHDAVMHFSSCIAYAGTSATSAGAVAGVFRERPERSGLVSNH